MLWPSAPVGQLPHVCSPKPTVWSERNKNPFFTGERAVKDWPVGGHRSAQATQERGRVGGSPKEPACLVLDGPWGVPIFTAE